jgi:hypothetical protein
VIESTSSTEQLLERLRSDPEKSGRQIDEYGQVVNLAELAVRGGAIVRMPDSNYDGHSRLKVSVAEIVYESKNLHGRNPTLWSEHTEGGGGIAFNYQKAGVELTVGTAAGDVAERTLVEFPAYTPGKVQAAGLTAVMNAPKPGLRQEYGFGYYREKIVFRMEGLEPQIVMRSYTTGAVIETIHPRDEWNGDPSDPRKADAFDGDGPSGIVLDVTKIQLLQVDYLWQGAGFYGVGMIIDGKEHQIHRVHVSNHQDAPWIRQGSLPLTYRIENIAETVTPSTMLEVCSEISSEGGALKTGLSFSADNDILPVGTSTTDTPILLIRMKQRYSIEADENRRTARFKAGSLLNAGQDVLARLLHIHDVEYTINIGAITGGAFTVGDPISAPTGSGATATITALDAGTIQYIETGQTGVFIAGDVVTNGVASATIAANGATVWADADPTSGVEYSVVNAVTNAVTPAPLGGFVHRIDSVYNATGAGNKALATSVKADELDKHTSIHQNRDSTNSEVLAVYAKALTGTGTARAALRWLESE